MARKESWLYRWMPLGLRNRMEELLQRSNMLLTPSLLANPSLSAKLFAYRAGANEMVVSFPAQEWDPDGLPIPPRALRIAETDAETFCRTGREDVEQMMAVLGENGLKFEDFQSVLEFGCSSGRLIRWLHPYAGERDIWGVDLAAEHIYWCQENLAPIQFATVTTAPHLPFEDRTFDFVLAGSVFTHLDDLADATFLELRRVLKPGGHLYATILGTDSLASFQANPDRPLNKLILGSRAYREYQRTGARTFAVGRSVLAYVVHDTDKLLAHLRPWFETVAVRPKAYRGVQTGLLLRKPARPS